MRRLLRLLRDSGIPAIAVVAFDLGQRHHLFQVLPANPVLDGQYRNLGLLLGVLATLVASADFGSRREFDLRALLGTLAALIVTLLPFIGRRDPAFFRLSPDTFAMVSIVAYLGLYVAIGILIGGGWIRMVREVARPTHPEEPASWS